jgi:hypothetical protein
MSKLHFANDFRSLVGRLDALGLYYPYTRKIELTYIPPEGKITFVITIDTDAPFETCEDIMERYDNIQFIGG